MSRFFKNTVLVVSICFLLFGCSSDDDDDIDTSLLVGEWIGESIYYTGELQGAFQGLPITADIDGEGYDINYTISFNDDLTDLAADGGFSMEVTITILGQSETFSEENLEFDNDGAITVVGDQIIFDGDVVGAIDSLTNSYLELNFDVEEEMEYDGITYTAIVNTTLTFTR